MRIKQFWTQEKWIRVTDDEENTQFIGLNQPVTVNDMLGQFSQEEVAMWARQNGVGPGDPRLQQVVRVENDVRRMDVDIIIEDQPDTITLAGETFEQLVNLSTAQPGSVPIEILIEAAPNLDRKIKEKLLERLEQQNQMQAQQGEEQKQVAMQGMALEADAKQAATAKDAAQAEKYRVDAFTALRGY